MVMSLQAYVQMFACAKCLCMETSTEIDSMGMHWCEKHKARKIIVSFGYRNAWPALATDTSVLMPDCEAYLALVKRCKDEQCIAALVQEIARLDEVA